VGTEVAVGFGVIAAVGVSVGVDVCVGGSVGVLDGSCVGDDDFLGVRVYVACLVAVTAGDEVLDGTGWNVRVGSWVMVVGCRGGSGRLLKFGLHATARLNASRVPMVLNTAIPTATLLSNHLGVIPKQ